MCGIYGYFHRRDPLTVATNLPLIERMAQRLAHRGPDGYGIHHDGLLAFGAGRLAIIDLSAPAGPIFSEDRRVSVVFNGEIYNHRALRAELEREGHHFATHTDTEVIVHGYEQWGVEVLSHLRGMFAVGLWDSNAERLLLARDRLGEKPLYYAEIDDQFLFASEIKALLECEALHRCVNAEALPYYLTLGYTPPPMTMFEGVFKLAPGELMIVERNSTHKSRYWTPTMDARNPEKFSYPEAVRRVREAVFEAVETRLMSDVPIGAFLSGGLDSTAVVAIMSRLLNQPARTFTVGFDEQPLKFNLDDQFAALAAQRLNTDHSRISLRMGDHLATLLPHLIYALDEPIAQPAIVQTIHVTALARLHGVPVLLSGDAGDELFAGYNSYRADVVLERYLQIPRLLRSTLLTPLLEHVPARFDGLRKLAAKSRLSDPVERYLTWARLIAPERQEMLYATPYKSLRVAERLASVLRPLLDMPKTRHFADRIAFTGLSLWIPEDSNMRVDKMSMAMGIEARAPLEDHRLVALALNLPLEYKLRDGGFKAVFKDAVRDLVPNEILERPKWGFFPPISTWLRTIFRPLVDRYLSPQHVAAVGVFDPATVSQIVDAHINQNKYELWSLWTLLVFHLWHAIYIEGETIPGEALTPALVMQR
ncbi:MAG: asparagine synthase (glutamine-hydrolyzing) [Anaerolineae bacterium]|nr:asparagine synthase (glutamine-hydrolyzing) [Anaerolineae bacterium]